LPQAEQNKRKLAHGKLSKSLSQTKFIRERRDLVCAEIENFIFVEKKRVGKQMIEVTPLLASCE
jgi:hypothetical protein